MLSVTVIMGTYVANIIIMEATYISGYDEHDAWNINIEKYK